MKQNACYFCRTAQRKAWDVVTVVLSEPMDGITCSGLNYLRALVMLAYRAGLSDKHTVAGFLLQGLLSKSAAVDMHDVEWLETKEPVKYPNYIWRILYLIERKAFANAERQNFKRYAPYLNEEMIKELFGEDG